MIRAVLDTNIIVSSLFWKGAPNQILDRGVQGAFVVLTSRRIIEEAQHVLIDKMSVPVVEAIRLLNTVITVGIMIPIPRRIRVKVHELRDSSDLHVLQCAVEGKADYIVTGDRDLLDLKKYETIQIITPSRFLKLL